MMNEDRNEIIPRWIPAGIFHEYKYITANTDVVFNPDVKTELN
jgi:hypothetical protein